MEPSASPVRSVSAWGHDQEGISVVPPNKRRVGPGSPEHHGRVTSPRDRTTADVAPSSRYTPHRPSVRQRPDWHKGVGLALLIAGVAIAVLNDVMRLQPGTTLLPGGHTELYLLLGLAIGGSSMWWFGWFDRER